MAGRSLSLLSRIFGGSGGKRVEIGTDQEGNRYFEESAGPDRRPRRIIWAPGQRKDDDPACSAVPTPSAEWNSWLRHRRPDPPTLDEVAANANLAALKSMRGAEIAARDRERRHERLRTGELLPPGEDSKPEGMHSASSFPAYGREYEEYPGAGWGDEGNDVKKK